MAPNIQRFSKCPGCGADTVEGSLTVDGKASKHCLTCAVKLGTRRDNLDGHLPANGEYGKNREGIWTAMTPNGHLANLSAHTVTEHEDGTITVEPSILVKNKTTELWHGYLRKGMWEAC